jgi:septal ring factor EnvC (AmiA/AmiB activator)
MIAELQDKLAAVESGAPAPAAPVGDSPLSSQEVREIERKLEEQNQLLDAERKKLEEEREALRQEREELQLMEQDFRNIEVKNARERAEINRQKADFQKLQRQFDFLLSQATKKPEIEKALSPVIQLREQIRKSTGQ